MKVKIIGYERNKGFSAKKNKNYDFHILHVSLCAPLRTPDSSGHQVLTIPIEETSRIIETIPAPGQVWDISYDFNRRIDSLTLLEE